MEKMKLHFIDSDLLYTSSI